MLTEIFVRNLAIVDELTVSFQPGFNVLTGETGAGKSIVIQALSFLLGERGDVDLIRAGQETMLVEAAFDLSRCAQARDVAAALEIGADDTLIFSRELSRTGRSRIRINGRPATLSMLRQLSGCLVDIHGQHEHQSLLQASSHLRLLDSFGREDLHKRKEEYRKAYRQLREVERAIAEINQNERERNQRLDLLRFQADEIDKAQLREGEEDELAQERQLLANAEKIADKLNGLAQGLSGDGAAGDRLAESAQSLAAILDIDPAFSQWLEQLSQAQNIIQDVSFEAGRYLGRLEFDPERLSEVEERLHLIQRLTRKYADNTRAIIAYRSIIQSELDQLENGVERLEELQQEGERLHRAAADAGTALSQARSTLAAELERTVQDYLGALALEKAEFRVAIETRSVNDEASVDGASPFGPDGIDEVQFLISTNPGQPLKPLAKTASGGELSRIMLALKASLQSSHDIPVLIFDEIDTGIGGRTAEAVGQKLRSVAQYAQVLSVTHLPQIASLADWHLVVEKVDVGDKSAVTVAPLEGDGRACELARMLSGSQVTEASIQHARELLNDEPLPHTAVATAG